MVRARDGVQIQSGVSVDVSQLSVSVLVCVGPAISATPSAVLLATPGDRRTIRQRSEGSIRLELYYVIVTVTFGNRGGSCCVSWRGGMRMNVFDLHGRLTEDCGMYANSYEGQGPTD